LISVAQRSRSSSGSGVVRAEGHRHAEKALSHAFVDLSRQIDPLREPPAAFELAGHLADVTGEGGRTARARMVKRSTSVRSKGSPLRSAKITPSQRPAAATGVQVSLLTLGRWA